MRLTDHISPWHALGLVAAGAAILPAGWLLERLASRVAWGGVVAGDRLSWNLLMLGWAFGVAVVFVAMMWATRPQGVEARGRARLLLIASAVATVLLAAGGAAVSIAAAETGVEAGEGLWRGNMPRRVDAQFLASLALIPVFGWGVWRRLRGRRRAAPRGGGGAGSTQDA